MGMGNFAQNRVRPGSNVSPRMNPLKLTAFGARTLCAHGVWPDGREAR